MNNSNSPPVNQFLINLEQLLHEFPEVAISSHVDKQGFSSISFLSHGADEFHRFKTGRCHISAHDLKRFNRELGAKS